MKKLYKLLIICLLSSPAFGQVYLDQFDDGVVGATYFGQGYTSSEADGEWTVEGDGSGGAFELFGIQPTDETGTVIGVDLTENNKVFVRAKANSLGTQLRMDVKDGDGYATTLAGITRSLINDYVVFEFDFSGQYNDGGFGGTSCNSEDAPCPVDGTNITAFEFYVNPGQGNWFGSVVLDYISVGVEPGSGPMSDVWQDHFDDEESLGYMGSAGPGLVNSISDSQWKITGDGTNGMWEPVNILMHNLETSDTIDISTADGDDKVYIRMKSTAAATSVRLDLMDINDFATTAGSITKLITDEFETYEFNFAGSYQDLAFGGTGCTSGPCPVDPDRIANMILFVNPGVEAFVGEVAIEYISVGTALEETDNNLELVYADHFSTNDDFINVNGAYEAEVEGSILGITGDGTDAPFSNVLLSLHDDETGPVVVDATGNNKVFLRARSDAPNTLLRIDLIDTAGFITSLPSFTRLLDTEFSDIEIDFTSSYADGGYGGTPCDEGPCDVDGSAISSVVLYPNPADGGFLGTIEIDYISFGAPLGDDVFKYTDHFDNEDRSFFSDAAGFTVTESGTEMVITGDGTAGQYAAFNYQPHNQDDGSPYILDLTSNNKLYVRAKSDVAGVPLRIDLVDQGGYVTTNPSVARAVMEDYTVLEYDFTGTYIDGGFGGTSCNAEDAPCPVDGSVVANFLFYIDPDVGGFNGTVTIDWFSTIDPIENDSMGDPGPKGVEDYVDEMTDNSLDYTSGTDGYSLEATDGTLRIIGDGTGGPFSPILYQMHDGMDSLIVDAVANDNKLYIRARSTVDGIPLRIDVQDNQGFLSSLAGLVEPIGSEYEIYEYDYSGRYSDGGFGGTPCDFGPCPVDGERIEFLQFYINPGIGEFNGELQIDWITFGEPLMVNSVIEDFVPRSVLFPNPAFAKMYLDFQSTISGEAVAILRNPAGLIANQINVGQVLTGDNHLELDFSGIKSGLYFMELQVSGTKVLTQKVILR